MNKELIQVKEFHTTFNQPVLVTPTIPSIERCELRYKLIAEELEELKDAFLANDIIEIADALSDLRYVLNGAYLEFGLADISERLFDEVHRSNMSKACLTIEEAETTIQHYKEKDGTESEYKEKDGKFLVYRTIDNKVLKSINYSPADLKTIIEKPYPYGSPQNSEYWSYFDRLNSNVPTMSDEEAEKEFPPFKVKKDENQG